MGILEALKNDIEKTYEYKVGYQEGVVDVLNDLDELLEDIRKHKYHECNKQSGDEWTAVDIRDVEALFEKFEERYTK